MFNCIILNLNEVVQSNSSSGVENILNVVEKNIPSNTNRKKGFTTFLITKLLVSLDKFKISDGDAIHIFISTAEALKCI